MKSTPDGSRSQAALHDHEAEHLVIAAFLVAPMTLDDADVSRLQPGDFHNVLCAEAWKVIQAERRPLTIFDLAERLNGNRERAEVEFAEWVTNLDTSLHSPARARRILDLAERRRGIAAAEQIARLAFDRDKPAEAWRSRLAQVVDSDRSERETWTAEELCALTLPDSAWLLPGHVPEAGLVLIAGDVGGGKTFAAVDLALAAASGGPAIGTQFAAPTPTLYLGADNSWRTMAQRVRGLCAGRGIDGPPLFSLDTEPLSLADASGVQTLAGLIRQTQARLVVLDVLARYAGGLAEDQAWEIGSVLTSLRALANRTGAAFVILHHTNKASLLGKLKSWLSAVRGSSDIGGAVDVAYLLTEEGDRHAETRWKLAMHKNRDSELTPPMEFVLTPGEGGGLVVAQEAGSRGLTDDALSGRVLAYIGENPGSAKAAISRGLGVQRSRLIRVVDQLASEGKLTVQRGPRGAESCFPC